MKASILVSREIEIQAIEVVVPVRYDEEDIPNDFPGRKGDVLTMVLEIDTRKVRGWPSGRTVDMYMKVVDGGVYSLIDDGGNVVRKLDCCYVPKCIPEAYGDYLTVQIDESGTVTNWKPDIDKIMEVFTRED